MVELCRTWAGSDALAIVFELEAEGNEATVGGAYLSGVIGNPFTVRLADRRDLPRAQEILEKRAP
jgi:hypothetical protein